MWFLMAFLLLSALQFRSFFWIAGLIGLVPALMLSILLAIVGMAMVRSQGIATLMAAQHTVMIKQVPTRTLFDAACLFTAGIFLIIPGFFTDLLGFALMTPQVRAALYRVAARKFDERGYRRDPSVIEGEYVRLDDEP
jgi:UPF0716 protein FxsA